MTGERCGPTFLGPLLVGSLSFMDPRLVGNLPFMDPRLVGNLPFMDPRLVANPPPLQRRLLLFAFRRAEMPESPYPAEKFPQASLALQPAAFSRSALANWARLPLSLSGVLRPHLQQATAAPPHAAIQLQRVLRRCKLPLRTAAVASCQLLGSGAVARPAATP